MATGNQKGGGKKAKTRRELAEELGISVSTLWRVLKKSNLEVPSGLIFPNTEEEILRKLKKKWTTIFISDHWLFLVLIELSRCVREFSAWDKNKAFFRLFAGSVPAIWLCYHADVLWYLSCYIAALSFCWIASQLHCNVTTLLRYCVTVLLHYCIIAIIALLTERSWHCASYRRRWRAKKNCSKTGKKAWTHPKDFSFFCKLCAGYALNSIWSFYPCKFQKTPLHLSDFGGYRCILRV